MTVALEDLSDDELTRMVMQKVGSGQPAAPATDDLEHLSDAELNQRVAEKLNGTSKLPKYDPMQSLGDALHGVGQGATFGHLPQVAGAASVLSGTNSYDAGKLKMRAEIDAARARNPSLVFGGEVAGSAAVPGKLLGEGAGLVRGALTGAGTAALQNPGNDLDWQNLKDRLKNMIPGALLGGTMGKLADSGAGMAERRAFKALGPAKRDVELARQKGTLQSTGRELLDTGVIGNIPPSRDTMLKRVEAQKGKAGAAKSAVIDELEQLEQEYIAKFGHHPKEAAQTPGLVPTGGLPGDVVAVSANPAVPSSGARGGVDLDAIRGHLKQELALNPNLPEAAKREKHVQEFTDNIAQGKKMLPVKEADQLKTDTGKHVNWMRKNSMAVEPERQEFHKELYRALNQSVDDAASVLAEQFNPELLPKLDKAKKTYGAMATSEGILDKRIAGDTANRIISPTDYGMGMAAGLGGSAHGGAIEGAAAAAAATGINHFLRKYGNQISAKQLDNLSKALNKSGFFNSVVGAGAGALGAAERRRKLKALEE